MKNMAKISNRVNGELEMIKALTAEQERELCGRIKSGDVEAAHELAISGWYLAKMIIERMYCGFLEGDELMDDAYEGLYEAALQFDPSQGRFSTYAGWWVVKKVCDSIEKHDNCVRLPRNVRELCKKVEKAMREYVEKYEVKATDEELSAFSGLSVKEIHKAEMNSFHVVSLEGFDADCPDDHFDAMAHEELVMRIKPELSRLDPRTRKAACLKFGIDCEKHTMEEISNELNISAERVRQLINKALATIKPRLAPYRCAA